MRIKDFYTSAEIHRIKSAKFFNSREAAKSYLAVHGGQVYTGLHSESDWSRTRWYDKGWHLVNRTGKYAILP